METPGKRRSGQADRVPAAAPLREQEGSEEGVGASGGEKGEAGSGGSHLQLQSAFGRSCSRQSQTAAAAAAPSPVNAFALSLLHFKRNQCQFFFPLTACCFPLGLYCCWCCCWCCGSSLFSSSSSSSSSPNPLCILQHAWRDSSTAPAEQTFCFTIRIKDSLEAFSKF